MSRSDAQLRVARIAFLNALNGYKERRLSHDPSAQLAVIVLNLAETVTKLITQFSPLLVAGLERQATALAKLQGITQTRKEEDHDSL